MSQDEKMKYAKEMKAANYKLNGKEYATLRGYIIARLYAAKVVKRYVFPMFAVCLTCSFNFFAYESYLINHVYFPRRNA